MKQIKLIHALPAVFAGRDKQPSDIWLQDFSFERGQFYLVEAESGTGNAAKPPGGKESSTASGQCRIRPA